VYRATDGIPRLVNQLCDHVLILAAIGHHAPIGAAGIEEAWADLQQLPSPWTGHEAAAGNTPSSTVVEFGELDDELPAPLADNENAPEVQAAEVEPVVEQMTTSLDRIETGIAALSRDDTPPETPAYEAEQESQFRPMNNQPEIELVFHHAHNPFGERFEAEEVIVDPFASLEALGGSFGARPNLEQINSTIPFCATDTPTTLGRRTSGQGCAATPLSDSTQDANLAAIRDALENVDPLPGDDRDLLEIQDEMDADRRCAITMSQQPPRSREYRQLFAQLRRK
jgi:hypothetical protein